MCIPIPPCDQILVGFVAAFLQFLGGHVTEFFVFSLHVLAGTVVHVLALTGGVFTRPRLSA